MSTPRHAIVTVTSDSFVPGTLVMLHSFLRANPWFAGDIIVFHEMLAPALAEQLQRAFPEVRLRPASAQLTARLDALVAARPDIAGRRARLLSLDAFALTGYDQLIFCDSDMLFLGDFSGLFDRPDPLIACPDGPVLRGGARDPLSFAEVADDGRDGLLRGSFNAGMMVIAPRLLGEAVWEALLARVESASWEGVVTGHTDQLLLNRHFAGRATLVGITYNLLLLHRGEGPADGVPDIAEARALHFNGAAKPWRHDAMLNAVAGNPAAGEALGLWLEANRDFATTRGRAA